MLSPSQSLQYQKESVERALTCAIKGACDQLRRWTYAGGKQWKGLMTRREIEREVCLWGQQ